jgi:putative ABC transport system permease protein
MSVHVHVRRLLRSRVFLVTAVLVLGLGLGVNTILFNTVYALLWRPLNFPQPDRLVTVHGRLTETVTGQDAWILRQQTATIAQAGLETSVRRVTLLDGDEPLEMPSAAVDSGYLKALGLRPAAGRFFGEEEDLGQNGERRAVLTESAWRTRFGSDPSVVGRIFPFQDGAQRRPMRVIGVVSAAATLPFAPDAEILLSIPSASDGVRLNYGDALYRSVVRLRAGVALPEAAVRIDSALGAMDRNSRPAAGGHHRMEPLRSALAPANPPVLLLYGSACLLLALTCANLASLFVARAMARAHETSVHLALGATPWRLLRANFQEALLVCAAGTGLAFTVEIWTRPLIPRFIPDLKRVGPELLATGPVLLAFGVLICVGISAVVSVASGLRLRNDGFAEALSQGGRSVFSGAGRFRAALAAAQLAIVLTLLTVAGLVGRSFLSALRSDPGLDPRGILTFQASLPGRQPMASPAISDLQNRMASIPGVKSVTFAAELPVGSPTFGTVTGAGAGNLASTDPMLDYRLIGPSYFETLGAQVAAGRTFSGEEVERGLPVAILNQAAARLLFYDEDPVGRTVHSGFMDRRSVVVGVVKDIRTKGLDRAPGPVVYMPYLPGWGGLEFMVRSDNSPAALIPLLKARVAARNPAASLRQFRPLRDILDETVQRRIVSGVLVGGFALLGLMISSVGLYGSLAARVQQRRREIGVRIAMGATVRVVVTAVLAEGMRTVALGALAGLAGSVVVARLIQPQLYGVGPLDPSSFALALVLLSGAALAACLIPAFQAARVDPIKALNVQ